MTDEEIKALQDKVTQLEADKTSLVGETTELRKARADKDAELKLVQDALKAATEKNLQTPEDAKIAEALEKLLSQKEQERATANKVAAFDKFVSDNKEYHPDNDAGGIKRAALEAQFARFNQAGVVEVDAFIKLIGDANALLRGIDTTRQTKTQIPSTPSPVNQPKSAPDDELTSKEVDVIERNGWTKEKYLALKAKMPDFIESLVA
jgi:hypothetical protein